LPPFLLIFSISEVVCFFHQAFAFSACRAGGFILPSRSAVIDGFLTLWCLHWVSSSGPVANLAVLLALTPFFSELVFFCPPVADPIQFPEFFPAKGLGFIDPHTFPGHVASFQRHGFPGPMPRICMTDQFFLTQGTDIFSPFV